MGEKLRLWWGMFSEFFRDQGNFNTSMILLTFFGIALTIIRGIFWFSWDVYKHQNPSLPQTKSYTDGGNYKRNESRKISDIFPLPDSQNESAKPKHKN